MYEIPQSLLNKQSKNTVNINRGRSKNSSLAYNIDDYDAYSKNWDRCFNKVKKFKKNEKFSDK